MTIWIIPESERGRGAVCHIWLRGGLHNGTPTTRELVQTSVPPGDHQAPPPL